MVQGCRGAGVQGRKGGAPLVPLPLGEVRRGFRSGPSPPRERLGEGSALVPLPLGEARRGFRSDPSPPGRG
ncbi:protein of unknown function [Candidatus Promineifilum breve]|uniref:Uncharacterized protein n=1 Tax=Candidatus Promineifilum breve TaxID=1806508 RepID=A0A160T9B8_9CHLR|nr:protein of unknown function [Candidatus Promineifilum breve]